jgi:geranylgeranyl reductase family protein
VLPERFDVVVVGAGPAGSTAALVAARRGWKVALVDQRTFPRDKSCGDGIGPGAVRLLRTLHLEHILGPYEPSNDLRVFGPGGAEFTAPISTMDNQAELGYVLPRLEFDHRLREAALQAGAADLAGRKVTATGLGPTGRWVETPRGRIEADLVVAADGAYSVLRRSVAAKPSDRTTAIAMRAYATTTAPEMVFEWSRELLPAYCWIFPTGHGTANVGVGIMLNARRRRDVDLRRALDGFAESCRRRGIGLGELTRHRAHHLPLGTRLPRLAYNRMVLIGDAASMINPLSGEGIAYGMTAAHRLLSGLAAPGDQAGLAEFERWFRRAHRAHLRSCRVVQAAMSRPWVAERLIRAARDNPALLGDVTDLLFGVGRLRLATVRRAFA